MPDLAAPQSTPSLATRVGVLDYGSGNLHSVCRALAATGAQVVLDSQPGVLDECDALVVPGVGAFAACMAGLRAVGAHRVITDWVAAQRPLLGICVGHQVLFERGVEHGIDTPGLGLLPGVVERLSSPRLPHMGWNTVAPPPTSRLFAGLHDERFYFVHSYAAHAPDWSDATYTSHESDTFVSAVEHGSISSTQFHPEKSGTAGARLLRNWLSQLSDPAPAAGAPAGIG